MLAAIRRTGEAYPNHAIVFVHGVVPGYSDCHYFPGTNLVFLSQSDPSHMLVISIPAILGAGHERKVSLPELGLNTR